MAEFSKRIDDFKTTIMSLQNHSFDSSKLRFISPEVPTFLTQKWKNLMLKSLAVICEFAYADKDLIHDLTYVIKHISEDKFVQAIL